MKRVAKRWRIGILCLLFLVITALPVGAVGPFDGIWFVDEFCPSVGFFGTSVNSVTENDAFATYWGTTFNLVVFSLDPVVGNWAVLFGTRIDSTVVGTMLNYWGEIFGTFTITATSPTTFTGTSFAQNVGVQCFLSGAKVF